MAVRNYSEIGENAQTIVKALLANENLVKLLYYNDKDPLSHAAVSEEVIMKEVFGKMIKIVPIVGPKDTANSIVVLKFESFLPSYENIEFKTVTLKLEVITPLDNWIIKDENLRPFKIMGEIEKTLKNKKINGLGKLESNGAQLNFLTDEVSDYEMSFIITSYD